MNLNRVTTVNPGPEIMAEAMACAVVCANCHQLRHNKWEEYGFSWSELEDERLHGSNDTAPVQEAT